MDLSNPNFLPGPRNSILRTSRVRVKGISLFSDIQMNDKYHLYLFNKADIINDNPAESRVFILLSCFAKEIQGFAAFIRYMGRQIT